MTLKTRDLYISSSGDRWCLAVCRVSPKDRFAHLLDLAVKVRHQQQRQRGPKVYSLHAPEVECIGKGKARAPYEFGCKVTPESGRTP